MNQLFDFLFCESQEAQAMEGLAEELGLVWENCRLKVDKVPLTKALKQIGLAGEIVDYPGGYCMHLGSAAYRQACQALECPDNIHTLAELGWVAALGGDQAQTAEAPDCVVKFYELCDPAAEEHPDPQLDKGPTSTAGLEKLLKAAVEFSDQTPARQEEPGTPDSDGIGKQKAGAAVKHAFEHSLNASAVAARLLEL